MKALLRFVAKLTDLFLTVLSCFDRVIIKGHLPITNGPALEGVRRSCSLPTGSLFEFTEAGTFAFELLYLLVLALTRETATEAPPVRLRSGIIQGTSGGIVTAAAG
jgi:hypothetical protein